MSSLGRTTPDWKIHAAIFALQEANGIQLGNPRKISSSRTNKVSTAVAETLRRWKKTSMIMPKEELEKSTTEYMDELAGMGYSNKWKEEVLRSALVGYKRVYSMEQ